MSDSFQKILILAPHTDDGEFGCGASINKWVEEGKEVYYATFSACKQSVLPQFPEDILITEVKAATASLGIAPDHLILHDYEVRTFTYHRQEILDDLIKLRETLQPDLVLMPSLNDIHQDHKTIAEEGLRAFKFGSILCYEMPWNNLNITTNFHVNIDEANLKAKWDAINVYESQSGRSYKDFDFIKGLARLRGTQINTDFAEAFELIRWII